jgi:hypothetical protein
MPGTSLYQLSRDFSAFQEAMDVAEDGEIPAQAIAELNNMQLAIEVKADGVCRYRQNCLAVVGAIEAEIERLDKIRQAAFNRAEWCKTYMKDSMEQAGITKLKTPLHSLSICKNSQPSVTLKGNDVPPGFQRQPPAELDKKKAVEAWRKDREEFEDWAKQYICSTMTPEEVGEKTSAWWKEHAKLPPEITVTVSNHLRIS